VPIVIRSELTLNQAALRPRSGASAQSACVVNANLGLLRASMGHGEIEPAQLWNEQRCPRPAGGRDVSGSAAVAAVVLEHVVDSMDDIASPQNPSIVCFAFRS